MLAAAVLGLLKGVLDPEPGEFSFERDLWGPTKEELVYRAGPLYLFPKIPYGTTAVVFAADHVLDDIRRQMKSDQPALTATDLIARFGDVLLGGLMYESAYRKNGIATAIAAHAVHNMAVGVGSRLRR